MWVWERKKGFGRTYRFAGEPLIYELGVGADAEVWNGCGIGI